MALLQLIVFTVYKSCVDTYGAGVRGNYVQVIS